MTTWAKNSSEFIGFLTGFDGRDAFAKSQRFPVVRPPEIGDTAEMGEPPLEAQDEILKLVYEILGVLRKVLEEGTSQNLPSASALLDNPQVDRLFSAATRSMVEAVTFADSPKRFIVLQSAVEGLVTEAYTERLRNEFVGELTHSLKAFRVRLAKDRARYDDWRDELDGGVVLYDVFRPNLWKLYRNLWDKWRADMVRIRDLATHIQRIDETLKGEETDS